jgi:hypothetical protein
MGEEVPPKLNIDANALFPSVSNDFHKTNNLKYNSSMETHGQSLLQEGQAADIHNLVKLQRLIEQIGELHVRSSTNLSPESQSINDTSMDSIFFVFRDIESRNIQLLYQLPSPDNVSCE